MGDAGGFALVDSEGGTVDVVLGWGPPSLPGPLRNRPHFSYSVEAGRAAVAVASVEGPEAGTFELTAVTLEGDTIFSNRYRFPAITVPDRIADSLRAAEPPRLRDIDGQQQDWATIPPIYPPFTSMRVGLDGSIWLRGRSQGDERPFYVLRPDGTPRGVVWLPEDSFVKQATMEQTWVVERDAMDVPSILRYDVSWE